MVATRLRWGLSLVILFGAAVWLWETVGTGKADAGSIAPTLVQPNGNHSAALSPNLEEPNITTQRDTSDRVSQAVVPQGFAHPREQAPPVDGPQTLREWLEAKKPGLLEQLPDGDLSQLKVLDLRGVEITDEDLYWVAQLSELTSLSLYGTDVTDAGLWHLAGLTQLESINLRGTQVTAAGLPWLPTDSLRHLHLCHSQIDLQDLVSTPPMPALETLKLNFLKFGDRDVESLSEYPKLRHLEIDDSLLTDRGLARLMERNPGIRRLEIRRSHVSLDGLGVVRALHPSCEFVVD